RLARALLTPRAVRDPVAVGDLTDLQAAPAEVTVFHAADLNGRGWARQDQAGPPASDLVARLDPGLGRAQRADLHGAQRGVHAHALGPLAGEPLRGQLAHLAAQEHRLDQHDEDHG